MDPVFAYIDPGSGSLMIQVLIAAIVAAPFVFRQQVGRFMRRIRGEQAPATVPEPSSAPAATASTDTDTAR